MTEKKKVIELPAEENRTLFGISQSIYTDEQYEELKKIDIKQQNVAESDRTRYTLSAIIDNIKKVLSSVKCNNNTDTKTKTYYLQAYDFQKLGLYKRENAPAFEVKLSDLPHDIIYELVQLDEQDRKFVLKQAVSRIFEDINFDLYHSSISVNLKVMLL
jgi:hypothetical protein